MNFSNFLSDSSNSSYPFISNSPTLGGLAIQNNWILDIQLVTGISSVVADLTNDSVLLTQVVADASNVAFTLIVSNIKFVFTVARSSAFGKTTFQDAALHTGGSTKPELGFGFLQTGDLSGVPNGTYTGSLAILRSRACYLQNRQISQIRVANQTATVVTNANCDAEPPPEVPALPVIVSDSHILIGDVKLMGGYNSRMTVDAQSNSILIGAVDVTEQSEILPCDVFSKLIYPEGVTPNEANNCNELLYSINGVGPNPTTNAFTLHTTSGIKVEPRSAHALNLVIDQTVLFSSPYYEVRFPGQEFGGACNVGAWYKGTENYTPPTSNANDFDLAASFTGASLTMTMAYHSFGVAMRFKVIASSGSGATIYDSGGVTTSAEGEATFTVTSSQTPIRVIATRMDGSPLSTQWYYRAGCNDATKTAVDTPLTATVTGVDGGFTISAIPRTGSLGYDKTASGVTTRVYYGGNRWWAVWSHLATKRTVVWTNDNRGITLPSGPTQFYPPKSEWYVWFKNTGEKPTIRLSYAY